MKKVLLKHKHIEKFIYLICRKLKIPKLEIQNLSNSLIGSSLRGVDSHGIGLFPHYVMNIEEGSINNKPKMKFINKMPSVGLIDADNGFGHSASYLAVKHAVKIAKKNGIAIVGICNSTHHGASGAYSLEVAKNDCIGLCFTHGDAFAIPFNGVSKFHGTNPYSFSAPIDKKNKILVDFASTSIPWHKVRAAQSANKKLSKNVALDKNGKYTNNPNLAKYLSPLGGEFFGHKGFGLASSIEILCGPFLALAHSYKIIPMMGPDFKTFRNLGHIIIAISIDAITTKKQYFKHMSNYINDLKKQKPKNDLKIFYPGQKEFDEEIIRRKSGIPLDKKLYKEFLELDKKFKLNLF